MPDVSIGMNSMSSSDEDPHFTDSSEDEEGHTVAESIPEKQGPAPVSPSEDVAVVEAGLVQQLLSKQKHLENMVSMLEGIIQGFEEQMASDGAGVKEAIHAHARGLLAKLQLRNSHSQQHIEELRARLVEADKSSLEREDNAKSEKEKLMELSKKHKEAQEELATLQQEVARLKADNKDLKETIADKENQLQYVRKEKDKIDMKRTESQKEINDHKYKTEDLEKKVKELEKRLADEKSERKKEQENVRERVREMEREREVERKLQEDNAAGKSIFSVLMPVIPMSALAALVAGLAVHQQHGGTLEDIQKMFQSLLGL